MTHPLFSRIRTRLVLLGILPAFVISVILASYLLTEQLRAMDEGFTHHGQALSREVSALSVYGLFIGNHEALRRQLQHLSAEPGLIRVRVFDRNDNPVLELWGEASSRQNPWAEGLSRHFTAPVRGIVTPDADLDDLRGEGTETNEPPKNLGRVEITLIHPSATPAHTRIIATAFALTAVALALTTLIGFWQSRNIAHPIERLTQAITRIKARDLQARVEQTERGEIGALEEGFNEMARELEHLHQEMQAEIRQANADLMQTNQELEQKNVALDLARKRALDANRAKTDFLATMSHEIRTPLNGVIGFTGLLKRMDLGQRQAAMVRTLENSADKLMRVVNEILDFTRLEQGAIQLENTVFRVREVFEDALVAISPVAHTHQIELILMVYSDVPDELTGDPGRIRQILDNLLGNAIKFTDSGEVVVRVMREEQESGDFALAFTVSDTGGGIPEDARSRIFEPFIQGDSTTTRKYGGTGLGLSICRRLAEAMGGRVELDPDYTGGACFAVTLPLTCSRVTSPDRIPFLSGRTALACDDHPLALRALAHRLERLGMQVVALPPDAPELIGHLDQVDVVVAGFPVIQVQSGAAIERIQAWQAAPRARPCPPVVALLSTTDQAAIARVEQETHASCAPRPIGDHLLITTLREALGVAPAITLPASGNAALLKGIDVLVVDDHPINRELLYQTLRLFGASVDAVESGYEAVRLAAQRHYALILMDVRMAGMDGIEASRRIRAAGTDHERTPIIAVTGDINPEIRIEAEASGMDDFILKPLTTDQVLTLVERWVPGVDQRAIELARLRSLPPTQPEAAKPATPPVPVEPPVHDWGKALALAANKPELALQLLDAFRDGMEQESELLRAALASGDAQRIRAAAHRFKGPAMTCALSALVQVLGELETAAAHQLPGQTLANLGERVFTELERVSLLVPPGVPAGGLKRPAGACA